MEVALLFAMVIGMMLIGVPIAVSLGLSSILFLMMFSHGTSLASVAQTLFSAFEGHYTLLAIPFFILASVFMSTGGVANRIIRFAIAVVGSFRGGLAIASVFACMLFAALSGSSPATVVAIGSIVIAGMTGGIERAGVINRELAAIAERRGYGFGLGSQRAMQVEPDRTETYRVREVAPTTLVLGNIGAVHAGTLATAEVGALVADVGADALCVHLNPAMELVQPEGDRDFTGCAATLRRLAAELPVPVIAAVHGVALGGGFQMALGADIRYAAPGTRMSIMEIKWGLIPDMALTTTLRDILPVDKVKELAWSGRPVSAWTRSTKAPVEKSRLRGLVLSYPEISIGMMRALSLKIREGHARHARLQSRRSDKA